MPPRTRDPSSDPFREASPDASAGGAEPRRVLSGELIELLAAQLGTDAILTDPSETFVYENDGSILHPAAPSAVVFPRSTEDVGHVVRTCTAFDVPYVARGAGTGLSGGAMALDGGVVVALNRMDRILDVDVFNRRLTAQPGVTNLALSRAVAEHDLYYAPDPSSQAVCTIGGNVAHNSGGPHTLKYGVTVNHVVGLELVLPDGSIVNVGGSERGGYDLLALLTGSEGTLGIVTAVTVRLLRKPEAVRTLLAAFATPLQASRAVSAIIAAGIVPAALEMLDAEVVAALEAAFGFRFPTGAGALLVVESDGPREGIDEEAETIAALCRDHEAIHVRLAADEAERNEVWKARKQAFGALGRVAPNYCTQDGVIPRTRLPEILERIAEIGERHQLRVANVFHAGDGNLHPCILFDERDQDQARRVVTAGAEILRACVELGGSLSGEHGIGVEKREWMAAMFAEQDLALMERLRNAFDPRRLCNPLKILPTGGRCVELAPSRRQAAL